MLIPQSLSYAKIATIPVEYGLMSSWLPPTIYAIMGSTKGEQHARPNGMSNYLTDDCTRSIDRTYITTGSHHSRGSARLHGRRRIHPGADLVRSGDVHWPVRYHCRIPESRLPPRVHLAAHPQWLPLGSCYRHRSRPGSVSTRRGRR